MLWNRPSEGPFRGGGGGGASQEDDLLLGPSELRSSDEAEKSGLDTLQGSRTVGVQARADQNTATRKPPPDGALPSIDMPGAENVLPRSAQIQAHASG
jgi:hypothetical protein